MYMNVPTQDASELINQLYKTDERRKLDELNARRKANGQELEPITEELMTEEELRLKREAQ